MTRPLFRAAALIIAVLLDPTAAVQAAGSPVTQSPGYDRMRLGTFEITALSDGTYPPALGGGPVETPAGTSVNGYLIDIGNRLLLIDTGAGTLLGPGLGKLADNLRAAGYQPEQVDEIYITDMHPAHIGGLLSQRKATFPNAIVRVLREQADYWLAKSSMAAAPMAERQQFAQVAASFKPYLLAGRLKTFDDEADLVPGIRALPNPGHVPRRTSYVARSGREEIVFCGDTMRETGDQIQDGGVLFKNIAAHGFWVAGANMPFPGIGHLRAQGHAFKFVPMSLIAAAPAGRSSGSVEAARP